MEDDMSLRNGDDLVTCDSQRSITKGPKTTLWEV